MAELTTSRGLAQSRYGQVLAIPAFRSLWLANMLASFGDALSSVALPLLAYAITGSAQLASQVFVARLLPTIILSPISGTLVDRFDRRRLMLATDVIRAALVAMIPFATTGWQLGLLAALVSANNAVSLPAGLASVPAVVPPSQLVSALSLNQVGGSVIRVVGPALGAAIIGFAGPRPAFLLQAVCFLVAAAVLLPVRLPPVARGEETQSLGREMLEGLRTVRDNAVVRGTAAVEALWQVMMAMIAIALVVFVDVDLGHGEGGGRVYALLMATMAFGAAVGALVAGRLEARIGRSRLMAIGYLGPLFVIPVVLQPPLPVVFGCWFLFGLADAWAVIAMQAYLAESVPDRLRGRVYAAWGAAVTAGGAAAFLVMGWLTTRIGAPAAITLSGLLVGIGGPLLLIASGALAAMRAHRPIDASG